MVPPAVVDEGAAPLRQAKQFYESLKAALGEQDEDTLAAKNEWLRLEMEQTRGTCAISIASPNPSDAELDKLRCVVRSAEQAFGQEHPRTERARAALKEGIQRRKESKPLAVRAQEAERHARQAEQRFKAAQDTMARAQALLEEATERMEKASAKVKEAETEVYEAKAAAKDLYSKLAAEADDDDGDDAAGAVPGVEDTVHQMVQRAGLDGHESNVFLGQVQQVLRKLVSARHDKGPQGHQAAPTGGAAPAHGRERSRSPLERTGAGGVGDVGGAGAAAAEGGEVGSGGAMGGGGSGGARQRG